MSLRGQGRGECGYAMAALLVAVAVMAIMMAVAMPVWKHDVQREKEAELVWRGNQYVRAIRLFQAKTGTFPTSVDMLVQGRFLRQKYLDPITNSEFSYIGAGSVASQPGGGPVQANPGAPGQAGAIQHTTTVGGQPAQSAGSTTGTSTLNAIPATASNVPGGLIGVQSKSQDDSIMIYNGRSHYNEWVFLYVGQNPGGLGGRGSPVVGPGGRGVPGQNGRGGPGGQNGRGRGGRNGQGGGQFRGDPGQGFPFQFPPGGRGPGRGQ